MSLLDLNQIENLWRIVNRCFYKSNKQFSSKNKLWEAISIVCEAVTFEVILNLIFSMDNRLHQFASEKMEILIQIFLCHVI